MNGYRMPRQRVALTAAVLALTVTLAGCGGGEGDPMPSDDTLFDSARAMNAAFKEAVGEVQLQIDDGEWRVGEYGDVPTDCDDGYGFALTRETPEDWRAPSDALTEGKRIGEWLGTNGWSDVQVQTYSGEVENVVVQARKPDAYVDRLDIDILPGDGGAGVTVRADSTCQDGDPDELMAILYPGWPTDTVEHEPLPRAEAPDATPIFGFTEDGQPR